jgi:hypothetical protein
LNRSSPLTSAFSADSFTCSLFIPPIPSPATASW